MAETDRKVRRDQPHIPNWAKQLRVMWFVGAPESSSRSRHRRHKVSPTRRDKGES